MRTCLSVTAALGLIVAMSADSAAEPLAPTEPWTVDFAPAWCVAVRPFGDAQKPIFLTIKPAPEGDVVQLSVVKDGGSSLGMQEEATIDLGVGDPIKVKQLLYGTNKKTVRMVNFAGEQASRLAQASRLTWTMPGADRDLQTGSLAQLMEMLEKCRKDLRQYWNVPEGTQAKLASPPGLKKPLISLFSSDDYPSQAVWNRESGTASIMMLVDETGKLRDCMVTQTSGVATLDAMTCIIVRDRGKFIPAVGLDGKPARGVLTQRVRWVMP